jgi:hypothetical protein
MTDSSAGPQSSWRLDRPRARPEGNGRDEWRTLSPTRCLGVGKQDQRSVYETEGHRFESCRARSPTISRTIAAVTSGRLTMPSSSSSMWPLGARPSSGASSFWRAERLAPYPPTGKGSIWRRSARPDRGRRFGCHRGPCESTRQSHGRRNVRRSGRARARRSGARIPTDGKPTRGHHNQGAVSDRLPVDLDAVGALQRRHDHSILSVHWLVRASSTSAEVASNSAPTPSIPSDGSVWAAFSSKSGPARHRPSVTRSAQGS